MRPNSDVWRSDLSMAGGVSTSGSFTGLASDSSDGCSPRPPRSSPTVRKPAVGRRSSFVESYRNLARIRPPLPSGVVQGGWRRCFAHRDSPGILDGAGARPQELACRRSLLRTREGCLTHASLNRHVPEVSLEDLATGRHEKCSWCRRPFQIGTDGGRSAPYLTPRRPVCKPAPNAMVGLA